MFLPMVLGLVLANGLGSANPTHASGLGRTFSVSSFPDTPVPRSAHRQDGDVLWESARLPSERVPAGVSSIEIARGPTYRQLTLHRIISATGWLRRIIAGVDMLPIVPPGTWACPDEPVGPVVRLSFRSRRGNVLAEAVQAAGPEVGNCSPMYFSIHGHQEKPLAQGASVIDTISHMLGIKLLPG